MRIFEEMKTIAASMLIISAALPATASIDFGLVCDVSESRSLTNIEEFATIYWGQERGADYTSNPEVMGYHAYDCGADFQMRFEDLTKIDFVLASANRSKPLAEIASELRLDGVAVDTGPIANGECMCASATLELAHLRLTTTELEN